MKTSLTFAFAAAAALAATAAHADFIDARFSGTVLSQSGTAFAVGSTLGGEFIYNTATSQYLSFTIGGVAVAAGFGSSANITPDQYSALYTAQLSPVGQTGTLNSTFSVDLESLNKWPGFDAVALLTNASQLTTNLDKDLSNFGYYTANADGSNIRRVNARLLNLAVSAVPEPAALQLMVTGGVLLLGLQLARRGRLRR